MRHLTMARQETNKQSPSFEHTKPRLKRQCESIGSNYLDLANRYVKTTKVRLEISNLGCYAPKRQLGLQLHGSANLKENFKDKNNNKKTKNHKTNSHSKAI